MKKTVIMGQCIFPGLVPISVWYQCLLWRFDFVSVQSTRNEVWSNNISVNQNKTTVVINGVETYTHMHTNVQIEKPTLEILISE